jgi:hypothetical protein
VQVIGARIVLIEPMIVLIELIRTKIVATRLKEVKVVAVRPIKGYPRVILVVERPMKG